MWQRWVNGILGLWLIVAAFVITGSQTGNRVNSIIVGIVLLILGLWSTMRGKSWHDWVVTFVGLWMIVAGFWFPSSYWGNLVNDIAAGVVIAVASFWLGFSYALRARQE